MNGFWHCHLNGAEEPDIVFKVLNKVIHSGCHRWRKILHMQSLTGNEILYTMSVKWATFNCPGYVLSAVRERYWFLALTAFSPIASSAVLLSLLFCNKQWHLTKQLSAAILDMHEWASKKSDIQYVRTQEFTGCIKLLMK